MPHHRNPDLIANPQLVLIGRTAGFSPIGQRKNRESHSSHRNGRTKIATKTTRSKSPLFHDRSVSLLLQYGHLICSETSSQVTAKGDRREITRIGDFAN